MPLENVGHACGVSAIYAPGSDVILALFKAHSWMQLRGQESAGITATDGERFHSHGGLGLVIDVFSEDFLFSEKNGGYLAAIGHNRYSTTGSNTPANVQPIFASGPAGEIYLGHNGDLTNVTQILPLLEDWGIQLSSTMDSELIAHLIVHAPRESWPERIAWAMGQIKGSYSLSILTHEGVYLARDPMGNRPLSIGEVPGGFAAASCAIVFDILEGKFIREVAAGEIVRLDKSGVQSFPGCEPYASGGGCPFELIYFSGPENIYLGRRALDVRRKAGALTALRFRKKIQAELSATFFGTVQLALLKLFRRKEVDIVVGVPDSGLEAASGAAKALGVKQKFQAMRKNPASRRTFIDPRKLMRRILGAVKYHAVSELVAYKRVLVVDDSTIRWNAIINVLDALVRAGVKEIDLLFTWWPVRRPCKLGIDMYTLEELPSSKYETVEEVEAALVEHYRPWRVRSVTFATPEIIATSVGQPLQMLCCGCWSGIYPEEVIDDQGKEVLEGEPAAVG